MKGDALGAAGAILRALRAVTSNLGTVLVVAVAFGTVAAIDERAIYQAVVGTAQPTQETLLRLALAWTGAGLVQEVLIGPLFAAVAVYIGWRYLRGKSAGLYDAGNFALNRYGRMFLPHLGAQVSIQLGMLVVIPGVLFWMQYAFVDTIAALEDEKWPLSRSKKLTRGRRGRIFRILLPVILLEQVVIFPELWALEPGHGWFMLILVDAALNLIYMIVAIAFVALWADRTSAISGNRSAA